MKGLRVEQKSTEIPNLQTFSRNQASTNSALTSRDGALLPNRSSLLGAQGGCLTALSGTCLLRVRLVPGVGRTRALGGRDSFRLVVADNGHGWCGKKCETGNGEGRHGAEGAGLINIVIIR